MTSATATKSSFRSTDSRIVLFFMIAAGLARIAMMVVADFEPPPASRQVYHDPVSIRRDIQLVACGFHGLLARHGVASSSVSNEDRLVTIREAGLSLRR